MTRKEIIKKLTALREEIINSVELNDYSREHALYDIDDAISHLQENE